MPLSAADKELVTRVGPALSNIRAGQGTRDRVASTDCALVVLRQGNYKFIHLQHVNLQQLSVDSAGEKIFAADVRDLGCRDVSHKN